MFKKLISNLPFNPSLLGQVSFYAKRLKAEESIRRMGFGFMALAMFIQMFAVLAPPQKSLANSANNIINGLNTKQDILDAWDGKTGDSNVAEIYSKFGLTRANIANLSNTPNDKVVTNQADYWSIGRHPLSSDSRAASIDQVYKDLERPISTGSTTVYARPLKAWDIANPVNTYNAWHGTMDNGTQFWILEDCGNFTTVGPPNIAAAPAPVVVTTTPTPAPVVQPVVNTPVLNNCSGNPNPTFVCDTYSIVCEGIHAFAQRKGSTNQVTVEINSPDGTVVDRLQTTGEFTHPFPAALKDGNTHQVVLYLITDDGHNINIGAINSITCGTKPVVVTTTTPAPATPVVVVTTTVTPPAAAPKPAIELRKTIDGGARTLKPGDEFTYRFEYRNGVLNSAPATDVVMNDALDIANFDVVSKSVSVGTANISGANLSQNIGTVQYSAEYKLAMTLTVKLKSTIANGVNTCNTAQLTSSNAGTAQSGGSSLCIGVINPCPLDNSVASATDPRCTTPALDCSLTQADKNRTTKESTLKTIVVSSNPSLTHVVSYAYDFGDKTNKTNSNTALTDTIKHVYADGTYAAVATVAYTIGSDTKNSKVVTCGASIETTPDQPLTLFKSAQNITQKLNSVDTLKTKANAGNVIEYTLTTHNSFAYDRANYTISDYVGDVMDYTDMDQAFLATQGGSYDAKTGTVTWTGQTIKADSDTTKIFRVTVKNPIPATNQPNAMTTTFDCVITNKYGTEISIPINCPIVKTVATTTTKLPNTGPGTSIAIGSVFMILIAYFFARSRLLGKEIDLIRGEYATGGGF
jgi:hypothetical protein